MSLTQLSKNNQLATKTPYPSNYRKEQTNGSPPPSNEEDRRRKFPSNRRTNENAEPLAIRIKRKLIYESTPSGISKSDGGFF